MASGPTITLRLTIENPVLGVTYSLQDSKSRPIGSIAATEAQLSFDVPVRVAVGPKLAGGFVRREGPERRFIYIAIGAQAGDASCIWSRRAKIDIHAIPNGLLDRALAGRVLECRLPGRAKDDGPACATIRPLDEWRVADQVGRAAIVELNDRFTNVLRILHLGRWILDGCWPARRAGAGYSGDWLVGAAPS